MSFGSSSYTVGLPAVALDRDQRTVMSRVRTEEERRAHSSSASSIQRLKAYTEFVCCPSCQSVNCARTSVSVNNCERDQRNIQTRCCDSADYSSRKVRNRTQSASRIYLRKYLDVCVVVYFAFLVQHLSTCVEAAPFLGNRASPHHLGKRSDMSGDSRKPFWINPCGLQSVSDVGESNPSQEKDIYYNALTLVHATIGQIETFTEDYAMDRFKDSWNTVSASFSDENRPWLNFSNTDSAKLVDLRDIYKNLQVFAASLELVHGQIVAKGENFSAEISECQNYLHELLCEMQLLMNLKGLKQYEDVQRNYIPAEYRDISDTGRRSRDFIILKEFSNYMNYLQSHFTKLSQA